MSYTYESGRLKTVTNSAAAISYDYDTLDRVTARTETVDWASYTFSATWVPAGLKTETYPSGRVVTHTHNDAGQLLSLSGQTATEQRNYVTNAAWSAHGASKTLPLGNGVSETWNWNYRLQPTGVTAGTFSLGYKYCSDGSDTCGTNNGNLMQQTIGHANVTQSYTYDAFGRIADARERATGAPSDAWLRTYGYDTWGNRWVAGGSGPYVDPFTALGASNFNAQNQLVLGTAQYDPAGNQTRMGDYTFAYDAENRLKTSTINSSTVTHYYDGEGRRVKRVGPGSRTVVYAYGVDGELAAEYDTEPPTAPGGVQYVAVDHLGSTRAVMDGAGAITRLDDFLPFGETIPAGIAGRGASYPATAWAEVAGTSKRFTGKEREGEVGAGLDYFGARYYSGAQGRFTSPDEFQGGIVDPFTGQQVGQPGPLPYADITDPQTINKYAYVRNNPLRYTDPDGHIIDELFDAASIVYDVYKIVTEGATKTNMTALGADIAAAAVPFVTGAGAAVRLGAKADDVVDAVRGVDKAADAGRTGRQARLREIAGDAKAASSDRGWITQDINQIERGKRESIRVPPGKELAHERGREAAKGYSYKHSNLQNKADHRTQHKYDKYGRRNRERKPDEENQ